LRFAPYRDLLEIKYAQYNSSKPEKSNPIVVN